MFNILSIGKKKIIFRASIILCFETKITDLIIYMLVDNTAIDAESYFSLKKEWKRQLIF